MPWLADGKMQRAAWPAHHIPCHDFLVSLLFLILSILLPFLFLLIFFFDLTNLHFTIPLSILSDDS